MSVHVTVWKSHLCKYSVKQPFMKYWQVKALTEKLWSSEIENPPEKLSLHLLTTFVPNNTPKRSFLASYGRYNDSQEQHK